MLTRFFRLGLLLGLGMGSLHVLPACGDKFLVASRGTRFQRAPVARESASILIFDDPSSDLPRVLAGAQMNETLRKAGYRPTKVTTVAAFESALQRGGWDLVIAALSDTPAVNRSDRKGFGVLPVVLKATPTEWKETKRLYGVVLKGSANAASFLEAVDDAIAASRKTTAKAAKNTI